MKKLLLYIVVAIVMVSCGVSIYYVVRNDENIYSTMSQEDRNYLNIDEEIDIPVVHEKPNKKTSLKVECDSNTLTLDTETWKIKASQPGTAKVIVTSSNEHFGPFQFIFVVGNGSIENPYYIRNEADLRKIGDTWGLSDNYELVSDINMSEEAFEPIGSTAQPFNGTFSGSSEQFAINDLIIDKAMDASKPVGLFSAIGEKGKVEDLTLRNANVISRSTFSGVIAGRNYGLIGRCKLEECSILTSGNTRNYAGLVCGLNESKTANARVSLCQVNGSVYSSYISGGIVGYNKGGIIDNNLVMLSNVESVAENAETTSEEEKEYALFGGIAGFTMNSGVESKNSIIFNNLVYFDKIVKKDAKVGGIFGKTLAVSVEVRGYYAMLLYNCSEALTPVAENVNDVVLSSSSTSAVNYAVNATKTELISRNTYTTDGSTWNFKNIWKLEEGKSIKIDYENENFDYQVLPITGTVIEISSKKTLMSAINNMRANPSAKITYKIMGESTREEVTDENGETTEKVTEKNYTYAVKGDWTPIGTKDLPFAGTIIAEKDATITIKEANISTTFAGLFGYISKDAYISNVKVLACTYDGTMVGGIAAHNAGAKVVNCTVSNSTLTTTKYAGAICGYSEGTIENCSSEMNTININEEKERNIYLGGLVGKTRGVINSSKLETLSINVAFESVSNTICLGGIAGNSENAKINNSKVLGLTATAYRFLGRTYAGGIVGYSVKTDINKCGISESGQVSINIENSASLIGGLVGFMNEGRVYQSAVCGVILKGYSAAGLVSFCMGEISECYAGTSAIVEGKYTGGFSVNLYGKVINSYSICSLKGTEVSAGLATYLWKGSEIKNCYTYCAFGEQGEAYADTFSNYKGNPDDFGQINNTIIVGNQIQDLAKPGIGDWYLTFIISRDGQVKARVQVVFFLFKGTFNYIAEDALIGQADVYKLFTDLDFDTNIWLFDESTIGNSPTLKDVCDLGESATGVITQVQEDSGDEDPSTQPGEVNSEDNSSAGGSTGVPGGINGEPINSSDSKISEVAMG